MLKGEGQTSKKKQVSGESFFLYEQNPPQWAIITGERKESGVLSISRLKSFCVPFAWLSPPLSLHDDLVVELW